MREKTRIITAILCLILTTPVYAQTFTPVNSGDGSPPFSAGSVDLMIGGGFGGFLYPHLEPNFDIGVIPIADDFALSIGGGADFGICVLCAGLSAVTNYSVSSMYLTPFGKVAFHFGTLGGLLNTHKPTIDLYAGTYAGPTYYTFNWKHDSEDVSYKQNTTSFMIGPMIGVRLGLGENGRWLFYGEYRLGIELGYKSTNTVDANGVELIADRAYRRGGSDFTAGVGLRF